MKCTACRIVGELNRREQRRKRALVKQKKKSKSEPMSDHEPTIGMTEAGY